MLSYSQLSRVVNKRMAFAIEHYSSGFILQWNANILNLQGKQKLVPKIEAFGKLGVKFYCSTEEEK